ncbi:MAG TPA: DUF2934 domain-containing protein [Xanthobacteraceae bacterium]|jgi:hypothetical protein
MNDTLEGRIRERAYEIWNAAGRPEGQAERHWLVAEREVLAMAMARVSAPGPATRRPSRRSVPPATSKSKGRAAG